MDIQESVQQIMNSRKLLGDDFYDLFLTRHPEFQEYFRELNMRRQAAVLTTALSLIEAHYRNHSPAIEQYLQYLGTNHRARGIPPTAFDSWRDAMLDTLHAFHGAAWNPQVQRQWREAIDEATQWMFRGYQEHFHV